MVGLHNPAGCSTCRFRCLTAFERHLPYNRNSRSSADRRARHSTLCEIVGLKACFGWVRGDALLHRITLLWRGTVYFQLVGAFSPFRVSKLCSYTERQDVKPIEPWDVATQQDVSCSRFSSIITPDWLVGIQSIRSATEQPNVQFSPVNQRLRCHTRLKKGQSLPVKEGFQNHNRFHGVGCKDDLTSLEEHLFSVGLI